jgi:hypothetical protein
MLWIFVSDWRVGIIERGLWLGGECGNGGIKLLSNELDVLSCVGDYEANRE